MYGRVHPRVQLLRKKSKSPTMALAGAFAKARYNPVLRLALAGTCTSCTAYLSNKSPLDKSVIVSEVACTVSGNKRAYVGHTHSLHILLDPI